MMYYLKNSRFYLLRALAKVKQVTPEGTNQQVINGANSLLYDLAYNARQVGAKEDELFQECGIQFFEAKEAIINEKILDLYGHIIIELCEGVAVRKNVTYAREVLQYLLDTKGYNYIVDLIDYLDSDAQKFVITKLLGYKISEDGHVLNTLRGLEKEAVDALNKSGFIYEEHLIVTNELSYTFYKTALQLSYYPGEVNVLYLRGLTFLIFNGVLTDVRGYTMDTIFKGIRTVDLDDLIDALNYCLDDSEASTQSYLEKVMIQALVDLADDRGWLSETVMLYLLRPNALAVVDQFNKYYNKKLTKLLPEGMYNYIASSDVEDIRVHSLLRRFGYIPSNRHVTPMLIDELKGLFM